MNCSQKTLSLGLPNHQHPEFPHWMGNAIFGQSFETRDARRWKRRRRTTEGMEDEGRGVLVDDLIGSLGLISGYVHYVP